MLHRMQPEVFALLVFRADVSARCGIIADEHNSEAWRLIGYAHEIIQRYDLADISYQKSLNIDPNNARTLADRAHAFDLQGKLDEAAPLYIAAISKDPYIEKAYLGLGRIAVAHADLPGALAYFEIVADAKVEDGKFLMRHAPPVKARIRDRAIAEAIAKAAGRHTGPLSVQVEHRRQAPPRLYDLPSLQKTCGQRWGWAADKTLAVAQELYDGDGKKVITYPRAEARHLAENQIADVPGIVSAMLRLRGFAHLEIDPPVIRRGKSGHFCDKALEGVSHHAIVPNVNVMDDLEKRIVRLSDDEKRLFALICRSYLASVMPDYEYRQTVVTMHVPMPELAAVLGPKAQAEFRAVGRIPLKPGWKAAFGSAEPEQERGKDGETDTDQTLPQLADGQSATLQRPRVQAKETQPPPRYNEGTLVDAMQNAWRFVKDDALRERLKEAKGIGTPATRAEIIKGLKRQNMIAADGKLVVRQDRFGSFRLPTRSAVQDLYLNLKVTLSGAPPGEYSVRFVVRDLNSKKAATLTQPITLR